jgi:tetratricopeptide (TPR) repeat protein
MEESFHDQLSPAPEINNNCINCNSPDVLTGYPNKLCAPCRQSLINFPIPMWVKLFGAGVLVVMVISMIWLPQNFSAAINLEKAEKAEKKHEYLTEQRELEKAMKIAPKSEELLLHLAIASFYNADFKTLFNCTEALKDRKMEDTALVNRVNEVMAETQYYMPDSTFNTAFAKYKNTTVPDTAYKSYIKKYPGDMYAVFSLASLYADQEKYPTADTLLDKVLNMHPRFLPALAIRAMVKRELNQPDSSLRLCDEMLEMNHQNLYALSSKARTLIKKRKNTEALQMAKQVYALDKNDGYNTSTLILAYHFNNDLKKRDEMVALARQDSVKATYFKYVQNVISNKVKYQN